MGQVQDLGHLQVGQAQLGVHHLREMGRAIRDHRQVADRCVQPPLRGFAPEELAEAGIGLGAGHIGHAHRLVHRGQCPRGRLRGGPVLHPAAQRGLLLGRGRDLIDGRRLEFTPDQLARLGVPLRGTVAQGIWRGIQAGAFRRLARDDGALRLSRRLQGRQTLLFARVHLGTEGLAFRAHLTGGHRRPAKAGQGLLPQPSGQQG